MSFQPQSELNPAQHDAPPEYSPKCECDCHFEQVEKPEVELPKEVAVKFGDAPVTLECPKCHKTVLTVTEWKSTGHTHAAALGGACLDGGIFSIPLAYGSKGTKACKHTCPGCKAHLGTYCKRDEKKAKKEEEKKAKKEEKEAKKAEKKEKK